MNRNFFLLVLFAVVVFAIAAVAGASGTHSTKALAAGRHFQPPLPPPSQAIEACEGLEENADCGFTVHGDSITGKCRRGPDADRPLACAPDNPPPPPPPPPPAIDACEDLTENADCSFTFHGDTITGKCRPGPDSEMPLACAPADMPPPPPHRR